MPSLAVYALFLFSGAAGLLYEVLWSRQFAHHLGGSYPAVVAVVTAFLGGLAAGAAWGGRWAPRLRRPLKAYAILEAGIGVYGLLFPVLLAACGPLMGWLYRTLGEQPALHTAARFLVAALLLLPPTVAMGATLPVLVRFVTAGGGRVLGGTGLLYGINTVGAAGGALVTGFVLLPGLGLTGTLLVGVGVNLAVAAIAWAVDRAAGTDLPTEETVSHVDTVPDPADAAPSRSLRGALLLAATGSGVAAMLYQMAWTKALILAFGSSVHAFTLVVASFILGLGLGGLAAPLIRAKGLRLVGWLALLEVLVGASAWVALHQVAYLPLAVIRAKPELHGHYDEFLLWQFWQACRIVLLPTAGMGAAFPVLIACLSGKGEEASRQVGRVYGWNTAGTILGSIGGGMLLLPVIGIRGAILVGVGIHMALGAILLLAARPGRAAPVAALGVAAAAAAFVGLAPEVPRERLVCGPYIYGFSYLTQATAKNRDLGYVLRDTAWDMPFFTEGRTATIGVVQVHDGSRYLRINGKTDAGTGDMRTQILLGQFPALLHPRPKSALVVGLATGISAAAVASHGVERLDVVDICPEVVEACRQFDAWNDRLLDRPGVRVLVEDGRTHIEHSRGSYDLIVSEPTNPWIAGVSNLFTVEYFRACRERLATDGVICVWLQSYQLSAEDFRLILRTMRSVFPGVTVWECNPRVDFALVASKDDAVDLVRRMAERPFPEGAAAANLARGEITSREALLATLAMDRNAAARFAGDGELHTDDRVQLEFRAPRGAFEDEGYEALSGTDLEALADPRPALAFAGDGAPALRRALEARALARQGNDYRASTGDPGSRAKYREILAEEPGLLRAVAERMPEKKREAALAAHAALGVAGIDDGLLTELMWARSIHSLERARELCGGDRWFPLRLSDAYQVRGRAALATGDLATAEADLARARELHPGSAEIPFHFGRVAQKRAGGKVGAPEFLVALERFDEAIRINPRYELALVDRAVVLAGLGRMEDAEAQLRRILEMRWDSLYAMGPLGEILLQSGRLAEARALVERGLGVEASYFPLLVLQAKLAALPGASK